MATATEQKNGVAPAQPQQRSLIVTLANKAGLEPDAYFKAIKATVFDSKGSQEELIAFLTVANKYDLNPFTKEIYAFPKKGGGIQPIVSVDGWANIINSHPDFDGMTFVDEHGDGGDLVSITCRIYRKDRSHPIECTEYMAECKRATDPWRQWPRRMLRHKAMMQAARYAFGLAGIMDPDEAERAESVGWSHGQQQTKVGTSNINKLLEAMPAHKPAETHHEADEYVDAESPDDGNQSATNALDAILDAMAACKTRQDLDKKFADWQAALPDGVDTPIEAEARYAELRESLPDAPGAKSKQKNLMGE